MAFTGHFVAALSLGTFVSAFTVLCGARTDLPDRHMCCVFWLNIAAALIQILTAIVMVGWIMSIFWGMDMVILARLHFVICGCMTEEERGSQEIARHLPKDEMDETEKTSRKPVHIFSCQTQGLNPVTKPPANF
ncbi:PREDICTED: protein stum homolog [Fulmarus glacialis]|uniref:protein stum homolog n=1 Tax=Fulmarus glacialis TaxID=30455 RepID=UPI00051B5F45|nr:PREDICTED: protein stum homolog [Fulmarus glacialis]